ncbi:C-X-C motif chemokine 10-like [Hyperolius riggenbachi]|uniref:C-X-C motif chemokine 10-like n=1 Tax=Hyperolius riggenbachi TaxID=752182 RepID=UPI0035A3466E
MQSFTNTYIERIDREESCWTSSHCSSTLVRGPSANNMNNKHMAILCVLLISAPLIQGFAIFGGQRCSCNKLSTQLNVMAVAKLEVFPRSSSCENTEYIVTLKNSGAKRCVSPGIREVKILLSGRNRFLKHIPVIRHS